MKQDKKIPNDLRGKVELTTQPRRNKFSPNVTFGPFPDEILMSSIDRVLFYLGSKEMQKYLNQMFPNSSSDETLKATTKSNHIANQKEPESTSTDSCDPILTGIPCERIIIGSNIELKIPPDIPARTDNNIIITNQKETESLSTFSCDPRPICIPCEQSMKGTNMELKTPADISPKTTKIITKQMEPKPDTSDSERKRTGSNSDLKPPTELLLNSREDSANILKTPFSLSSVPCPKMLETYLTASEPKWLWTKQQTYNGIYQIFEVFTNSSVNSNPTHFDTEHAPRIIFIILPTGIIMPFETLPKTFK